MTNCCTINYDIIPDITIFVNCDTVLAVNLAAINLGDNDEFIFTIKNYDYIYSPYIYLFKARKTDIDENGEILFKIPPEVSRQIKQSAFYNFAVLVNAFDEEKETEYHKLTTNGKIILELGAQDLTIDKSYNDNDITNKIVNIQLDPIENLLEG